MRNTLYIVSFKDNDLLNESFDLKEEAIAWANEHISAKPIVEAIDCSTDEFTDIINEVYEKEIIFDGTQLTEELPPEATKSSDEVIKELEDTLAEWSTEEEQATLDSAEELADMDPEGDALHRDFPMYDSVNEPVEGEALTEAVKPEVISEIKSKSKLLKDVDDSIIGALVQYYSDCFEIKLVKVPVNDFVEFIDDEETLGNLVFDLAWDASLKPLQIKKLALADPKFVETIKKMAMEDNVLSPDGMDIALQTKMSDEDVYDWALSDFSDDEEEFFDTLEDIHTKYKALDENLEEDFVIFDPFGTDFDGTIPTDISEDEAKADCSGDYCVAPADWLKELAAELGIADEVEITPVSEVPVSEPTPAGEPIPEVEEPKTELVVSAEVPADVAAEVTPETPVTVSIPGEPVPAIESSETPSEDPIATEAPCEGEPCDPHLPDEKPAENIATCHVCPECGKEICECNKNLVESDNSEFEEPDSLIDDVEENADIISELSEDTHPHEAQPVVDLAKVGEDRQKMATAYGKPVIYGYMGADHHGENRYFEIEPIICDDLDKCRQDVMNKYHPSGSILVAYPNADESLKEDTLVDVQLKDEPEAIEVIKDIVDIHGDDNTIVIAEKGKLDDEEAPKIEVEVSEPEFNVLEKEFHEDDSEEEMSDEELAEKLYAAKKNKTVTEESLDEGIFKDGGILDKLFDKSFTNKIRQAQGNPEKEDLLLEVIQDMLDKRGITGTSARIILEKIYNGESFVNAMTSATLDEDVKLDIVEPLVKDEEEAIKGYEDAEKKLDGEENIPEEKIEEVKDTFEHIKDEEKEHIDEIKEVTDSVVSENLEEGSCCKDVDPESTVKPSEDVPVVDCKVNDVITHCEDEKPVDCLGKKKPLDKPLTEASKPATYNSFADFYDLMVKKWSDCTASYDELESAFDAGYSGISWTEFLGNRSVNDIDYVELCYEAGEDLKNGNNTIKESLTENTKCIPATEWDVQYYDGTVKRIKSESEFWEAVEEAENDSTIKNIFPEEPSDATGPSWTEEEGLFNECGVKESLEMSLTEEASPLTLKAKEYLKANGDYDYEYEEEYEDGWEYLTDEVNYTLSLDGDKFKIDYARYHASRDNNAEYPERYTDEDTEYYDTIEEAAKEFDLSDFIERLETSDEAPIEDTDYFDAF